MLEFSYSKLNNRYYIEILQDGTISALPTVFHAENTDILDGMLLFLSMLASDMRQHANFSVDIPPLKTNSVHGIYFIDISPAYYMRGIRAEEYQKVTKLINALKRIKKETASEQRTKYTNLRICEQAV